jgi:hypothetical protein
MARINIELLPEVHAKLHALAARENDGPVSIGMVVNRAIDEKFERDVVKKKCCPGFAAIGRHDHNCKLASS